MDKRCYFVFLWLCGFLYVPGFGFECPYMWCTCEDMNIFCSNYGFTSVPEIVSNETEGLTSLYLDWNDIPVIPAGSLPSNLTIISFNYNPITFIDDTALDGSSDTLELLKFLNARFTKIPDVLLHLNVLKHLEIYDSNITDWDVGVMKHLGLTLETLDLQNAGNITSPSWIQYFLNLTELTMDNCFVSDLPDNALDTVMDRLATLSVFSNNLTEVPKKLSEFSVLTKLNLGFNQISNITWLPQSNLTSLTLNNNNISDATLLSRALLPYADSLIYLTLQANKLTAIPDLGFLLHVSELDFTYNRISDPYSGSLPSNLSELNFDYNMFPAIPRVMSNLARLSNMQLRSNAIKEIKYTEFPPAVVSVELVYNLITELTDTSFPQNSTMQYLYLYFNPINKISDLAFKNLSRLMYLGLGGTNITRLPLAIASLSSLNLLDATNNPQLVCTCTEKSLGPRIASLWSGNVMGNCGETSIYSFFTVLSSGCP